MSPWERTIVAFSLPYSLSELCDADSDAAHKTPPTFKIRIASSDDRIIQANTLIRKKYEWRGYEVEGLVSQPNYVTLIIYSEEKLVATMTLGVDSVSGLSADASFKVELDSIRSEKNRKISEITKFAIEDGFGSKQIQASIIHITYIFARYVHACTDFVIEVNPRHVQFYEKYLGFKTIGQEKYCLRVNALSRLMHIDLEYMNQEIKRLGDFGMGRFSNVEKSLYPYFFHKTDEEGIAARLLRDL